MKKKTGIIRRIDDLGRVVIPKEVRRQMSLKEGDAMELYTDGEFVSFRRYYPACDFCGDNQGDTVIGGKSICPGCLSALKLAWAAAGVDSSAASADQEPELDCETEACAYNKDGVCRFHAVHGRKPNITEADGCTEGVIDLTR